MNSLNLGGHSGCGIFLIETDEGAVFVRKTSKDPAYNARLQAQCAKQRTFVGSHLLTPAVLREGFDEKNCYYFDMEYIQGVTLAEYVKTMEIGKIRGLVNTLVENLVPAAAVGMDTASAEKAERSFREKIDSLAPALTDYPCAKQALQMLRKHNWGGIIPSPCHGDLTLENIIVRNDRLYLIDFLDSFYDSWILDMGTLLQDVQTMWSYRKAQSVSMNAVLRLMVFRDLLLDAVSAIDRRYVSEIYYALLMKLVRIYPYTTDRSTVDFLDEKLQQVMTCLKQYGEEALP